MEKSKTTDALEKQIVCLGCNSKMFFGKLRVKDELRCPKYNGSDFQFFNDKIETVSEYFGEIWTKQ